MAAAARGADDGREWDRMDELARKLDEIGAAHHDCRLAVNVALVEIRACVQESLAKLRIDMAEQVRTLKVQQAQLRTRVGVFMGLMTTIWLALLGAGFLK